MGDHTHAEAPAQLDEGAADLARADHAGGFAVEIHAGEAADVEVELPGADVGLVQAAVHRQQHAHGVLRDGVGRVGGHAHHRKFALGGLEVHVAVTRAAHGQHAHALVDQDAHGLRTDIVVDEGAGCVEARRQTRGLRVQLVLVVMNLVLAVDAVEALPVVGLRVEKSDAFHENSLPVRR